MPELRNSFLREFTKELILNSAPAYLRDKIIEKKEKELEIKDEVEKELKGSIEKQEDRTMYNALKSTQVQIPKPNVIYKNNITNINNLPQKQNIINKEIRPSESKELEGLQFGKIQAMINDPNVVSIECPGPDKFITITTITKVISTRIMLNKNDINRIIESFSQESRIPRIGGVFKAIVNNLVITAIDSEYGGPKFIISKIRGNPSQFF